MWCLLGWFNRSIKQSIEWRGVALGSGASQASVHPIPPCPRTTTHSLHPPSHHTPNLTPPHTQVYYNEGYSSAGRIFAVFPLAALLCSPVASLLCRRLGKGKFGVWQLGLLISVASAFMFGCSSSIPAFFLFRGLQVR
jgi:MFS family permease